MLTFFVQTGRAPSWGCSRSGRSPALVGLLGPTTTLFDDGWYERGFRTYWLTTFSSGGQKVRRRHINTFAFSCLSSIKVYERSNNNSFFCGRKTPRRKPTLYDELPFAESVRDPFSFVDHREPKALGRWRLGIYMGTVFLCAFFLQT